MTILRAVTCVKAAEAYELSSAGTAVTVASSKAVEARPIRFMFLEDVSIVFSFFLISILLIARV
jgi:hypothetical protein